MTVSFGAVASGPARQFRGLRWSWFVVLAVCTALVYWPGLSGGYIFDDYPNLLHDTAWQVTAWEAGQWRRAIDAGYSSAFGRPLSMATFALNHVLTGLDPWPMKATNLAIHIANGVLILTLVLRLAGTSTFDAIASRASHVAWATAAIWMLHPLQVSTVLYVVQRMEMLATTCTLLALWCYVRARERQWAGRSAASWLIAAGGFALLGFGFKESALLTPAFALLIELFVFRFGDRNGHPDRRWQWSFSIGVALAMTVYLGFVLPHYLAADAYLSRDFSAGERLLTQGPVLAMYLGLIVWPRVGDMGFHYDDLAVSTSLWSPPGTLAAFALLLAIIAIAIHQARRRPWLSFGIGWFFVAHALTSNVVPLELAFEHRNYLALLGPALVAGCALALLPVRIARVATAGITIGLAMLCAVQAAAWSHPLNLAVALAARRPTSERAIYQLAAAQLEWNDARPGTIAWNRSRELFIRAANLPSRPVLSFQAVLLMDAQSGRAIAPSTWRDLHQRLSRNGFGVDDRTAIAAIVDCRVRGQCMWDDDALAGLLDDLVAQYPEEIALRVQRANHAFNVERDVGLSADMMRTAMRLDPDDPRHAYGLARFLLLGGAPNSDTEIDALIRQARRGDVNGLLEKELDELDRFRSASGHGSAARKSDAEMP